MEDLTGFGAGPALQLGFDIPGEVGPVAFAEDDVIAEGVDVFSVEEKTIHVKEAGADWRETGGTSVKSESNSEKEIITLE